MQKMKLDNDDKAFILEQKEQGMSSRMIAAYIGCGKSTVNDFLKKVAKNEQKYPSVKQEKQSAKILFLDIETSADIVATFGRYNVNLSEGNIIHQGNRILTAAWKFRGDKEVSTGYVDYSGLTPVDEGLNTMDEYYLVRRLFSVLEEADAVVIHNARFDLGTIQQRALACGFGRIPSIRVIDTLAIAKKHLKLRSNKLDSITKYFGLSNKMSNDGIKLWIDYQMGSEEAKKKMLAYNTQDVIALEAVYDLFEPLQTTFNHGLVAQSDKPVCPSCGSQHLAKSHKTVKTMVGEYESFFCLDCGAESRGRKNLLSKEVRQNLLVPVA